MEWINIKTQLPPYGKPVLLVGQISDGYDSKNQRLQTGYGKRTHTNSEGEQYLFKTEGREETTFNTILYWHPLPEPPKT